MPDNPSQSLKKVNSCLKKPGVCVCMSKQFLYDNLILYIYIGMYVRMYVYIFIYVTHVNQYGVWQCCLYSLFDPAYGTDMLSVNWTAIVLKQDNYPSEKSQCSSLCLTKFYTCWDGSKPLVHCYWENHGRLRMGLITIVKFRTGKILSLSWSWFQRSSIYKWVETNGLKPPTFHGLLL